MDQIEPLRQKLRQMDYEFVKMLDERFETVREIWKIKKQWGIEPRDKVKESMIVDDLKQRSNHPKLIEKIYAEIFSENDTIRI